MSYQIDTWKLKKLENFKVPYKSFFKHERVDWHPDVTINDDGTFTFTSLDSEWNGEIWTHVDKEPVLEITSIDCSGEGSATIMDWTLEPAFKDSQGTLIASCVWEGGDTINQLTVIDGKVEWEDIEI